MISKAGIDRLCGSGGRRVLVIKMQGCLHLPVYQLNPRMQIIELFLTGCYVHYHSRRPRSIIASTVLSLPYPQTSPSLSTSPYLPPLLPLHPALPLHISPHHISQPLIPPRQHHHIIHSNGAASRMPKPSPISLAL